MQHIYTLTKVVLTAVDYQLSAKCRIDQTNMATAMTTSYFWSDNGTDYCLAVMKWSNISGCLDGRKHLNAGFPTRTAKHGDVGMVNGAKPATSHFHFYHNLKLLCFVLQKINITDTCPNKMHESETGMLFFIMYKGTLRFLCVHGNAIPWIWSKPGWGF